MKQFFIKLLGGFSAAELDAAINRAFEDGRLAKQENMYDQTAIDEAVKKAFEEGKIAQHDNLKKQLLDRGGFATLQLNPVLGALPSTRFVEPESTVPVTSCRLNSGVILVANGR